MGTRNPQTNPIKDPTRAPKIFLDEYDPQQEVPYEEDYPPTSPERLIPIEIERPEQDIVVRRGDWFWYENWFCVFHVIKPMSRQFGSKIFSSVFV